MIPAKGFWTGGGDAPSRGGAALGSRGSRSHSAPARPAPEHPGTSTRTDPSPASVTTPLAPAAHRFGGWMRTLAGFAAGGLIGSLLSGGLGHSLGASGFGLLDPLVIGGGIALFVMLLRRRHAEPVRPMHAAAGVPSSLDSPPARARMESQSSAGSDLDEGVRDIRQTDPGFHPAKLAGYTGMVFRNVQSAWMTRDIGSLRDQLTPEMYGALQVHCERLRSTRQSNRIEGIEIRPEITEAWQEGGQDYVTACIGGSMLDYTVDDVTGGLVDGSRTIPLEVEEFWTFTRPAGLNFWMLSAIQISQEAVDQAPFEPLQPGEAPCPAAADATGREVFS